MQQERAIFNRYLKIKGLKQTSQRQEILKLFLLSERHNTAEELHDLVKKENPNIGYSTVYRTLKLLCDCGLAEEVHLAGGRVQFEHKYNHAHHDHLICLHCGKVTEFSNSDIEKLQTQVAQAYEFNPQHHKLEIYGICKDCGTKRK